MGKKRAEAVAGSGSPYDQASRFLLRLDAAALLLWLLRTTAEKVKFVGWLDTRQVRWPGQPERICDTVASLADRTDGDRPWALVVECQVEPDAEMFGRLLEYEGGVWRAIRPSRLRGDRYCVGAIVINLTGTGQTSQTMRLADTGALTGLGVVERNMEEMSAEEVLAGVAAKRVPRLVLAWLPLMQNGGAATTIQRWLELAREETDKEKRTGLGLAAVFAEKTAWAEDWKQALKGWDVMESKIVKEWTAQARAEGEAKGKTEGLREGEAKGLREGEAKGKVEGTAGALLRVLEARFKAVPKDLRTAIEAVADVARLLNCIDQAGQSRTLRQFRQKAGL
jgi:hypothetical protein